MSKARNLANFIGIPAINSSADATAITIDSGEKVGVGASSPQEKLHVYTTADARVEIESTTGLAAFKATNNQGSYAWYVDSSADKFHLYDFTDSANRITLDGAGNVGIGTTTPGTNLTIRSAGSTNIELRDDNGTASFHRIATGGQNGQNLTLTFDQGGTGASHFKIRGNGTSERIRINDSGKVGIGTTSPTTALHAESSSDENKRAVRVAYNSSYYGEMVQQGAAGTLFRQYGGANFKWNSGGTDYMLLATNNLHVAGSVTANSSSVSDERFKDNIQTVTGALDKVKGLRGVTYKWNKGSRKDQTDYGVIAQEVETVMPEIVHDMTMPLLTNDEETVYKTVDYSRLSAVLINAIKELEAKVAALESK
jgi:hypothetical protein